jgi:hypothetical protein
MSAAEAGAPYSFTLYELPGANLVGARARYVQSLEASGFQVVAKTQTSLTARRNGDVLIVNFQKEANRAVRVGIAELRER